MELIEQFKKGNRNYEILKTLIDAGGETITTKDLILLSINNKARTEVIEAFPEMLNDSRVYEKEVEMLKHSIDKLKKKIEGFNIVFDRKGKGYRLIAL